VPRPGQVSSRRDRVTAFVALGTNLGDREGYLRAAIEAIAKTEEVRRASSIYETDPVGYLDQPVFLNMVIEVETSKVPLDLLRQLRKVEHDLHRERTFPNAPRNIDLDLLLYGDVVLESPELTIPHPRLHERAFVLIPLAEIAPDAIVPTLGKTAQELRDLFGEVEGVTYWGEY
jgi:2-amino-4-hydroxy-6-hydroxymethyldihydropteridine diphosphokinase